MPKYVPPKRVQFSVSTKALLFYIRFDPFGDPLRENSFIEIEDFQRTFHRQSDSRLVIKVNKLDDQDASGELLLKVYAKVYGDYRFLLRTVSFPYEDLLAFCASCDVFISLSHAENHGLVPIETGSDAPWRCDCCGLLVWKHKLCESLQWVSGDLRASVS